MSPQSDSEPPSTPAGPVTPPLSDQDRARALGHLCWELLGIVEVLTDGTTTYAVPKRDWTARLKMLTAPQPTDENRRPYGDHLDEVENLLMRRELTSTEQAHGIMHASVAVVDSLQSAGTNVDEQVVDGLIKLTHEISLLRDDLWRMNRPSMLIRSPP